MKNIRIFAVLLALIVVLGSLSLCVGAEAVTDAALEAETRLGDLDGADLSLTERVPYAVQGVVTGMLMIFAVLILLSVIVSLSKYAFAPKMPKAKKEPPKAPVAPKETVSAPVSAPVEAPVTNSDDELIAVLTAAVAAMIDSSSEYRSQFASGFRVVSFRKVSENGAWNKN